MWHLWMWWCEWVWMRWWVLRCGSLCACVWVIAWVSSMTTTLCEREASVWVHPLLLIVVRSRGMCAHTPANTRHLGAPINTLKKAVTLHKTFDVAKTFSDMDVCDTNAHSFSSSYAPLWLLASLLQQRSSGNFQLLLRQSYLSKEQQHITTSAGARYSKSKVAQRVQPHSESWY